jgi:hypothetical protein
LLAHLLQGSKNVHFPVAIDAARRKRWHEQSLG